jgi:hypothetical protein
MHQNQHLVDIRSTARTQVVATRETICSDCYKGLHNETEDDDCIKVLRVSEQGSVSVLEDVHNTSDYTILCSC